MKKHTKGLRLALAVSLVGLLAATLEVAKFVLSALPNVEVVTLLCGVFGYVFGIYGILASLVFVTIEPLIYGFGTWVLSYYLYWPFVTLVFMLLGKAKLRNRVMLTLVALILTVWFGILTSLIDVGLFSGSYDRFFYRFGIYYMRGIVFYAIQLVCNAVTFPLLFRPLSDILSKLKPKVT